MTAITETATFTRYHWIMTLQRCVRAGEVTVSTVDGSGNLPQGSSRGAAFQEAMGEARRMIGIPAGDRIAVLFFSLEPDELP